MLLYAVASPRWVRGDRFSACPRVIARRSEEQCSIGFQPVLFTPSSDAFLPLYVKTTVTRLEEYGRSRANETTLTMLVSHLSCDAKLERSFRFDPRAESETIVKVIYA
jgi:hypothetical protein